GLAAHATRELADEGALWDRAERLARVVDRPDVVADAYEHALATPIDAALARAIGRRATNFLEEFYEDDRPLRLLRGLLEVDAAWAFERLKLALSTASRWDDLFDLYDARVGAASDDAARADVLEEASQVARDFVGDARRAVGYLEKLAALRPDDARVDAALERLYEREGQRAELIRLLGARLDKIDGDDAQLLRARIASLWLASGDEVAAFDRVSEMLAADADRAEAFELLERIVLRPRGGDGAPTRPLPVATLRRAAALLRVRFEASSALESLVRVVEVELGTATDDAERIALRRELAARKRALGDAAAAFEDVAALVALEPHVEAHADDLAALAAELGRSAALASVLASAAHGARDAGDRARMLAAAARVARDDLGDAPRAIDLFTAAMPLTVDEPERLLRVARELEPLLRAAVREAERCGVLEAIAEIEPDAAARREAFGEVAHIAADVLADERRAIRAWRARLGDDDRDAEALDGLVVALDRGGRFAELVEALERRIEIGSGDARADLVHVAELYLERLEDTSRGIAAWQRVRARFGPDDETFDALAALLEREGRWADLATLLEEQARAEREATNQVALWRRRGDVARGALASPAVAAAAYGEALAIDPRDDAARAGLGSLLADSAVRGEATSALARALVTTQDWEAAAALARELGAEEDAPADVARAFWWGVAVRHRDVGGDAALAEHAFARALA
ncbi:MAG TPA: hypothetical protein VGM56_25590, partial [Byssovorax sp.]